MLAEAARAHRARLVVVSSLGKRGLDRWLIGVMDKFHYLKIGLGVVLAFVGVKMCLGHSPWKIDTLISLGVIVTVLAASVVASLLWPKKSSGETRAASDSGAAVMSLAFHSRMSRIRRPPAPARKKGACSPT